MFNWKAFERVAVAYFRNGRLLSLFYIRIACEAHLKSVRMSAELAVAAAAAAALEKSIFSALLRLSAALKVFHLLHLHLLLFHLALLHLMLMPAQQQQWMLERRDPAPPPFCASR